MEQLQFSLEHPRKKRKKRRARAPAESTDAAFVRDATDILQYTLGPNPPGWRIYRLARLLREAADAQP